MREIFSKAKNATTITAREAILKEYGLHFIKNAFWRISDSDPYAAYSYDMPHAFDSGEWGKHQWPLLLKILTAPQRARLSKKSILLFL
ncbi:hypothetical protein M422DRAFT_274900 [Sphaerobolus stellatus SS14]|uniref:Uncharacterized protein n=2 Tax=Sphaerobolus stellatus (strain SS14) TaxID=990650 RepID=A0A0C9T5Z5_SPHS4|nr:hypothetical protein M422DRAFT_274900 [Sphaerobolus stellatus SS14]